MKNEANEQHTHVSEQSGHNSSMEMTSFINGQNNNSANGNDDSASTTGAFNGPRDGTTTQGTRPTMD